MGVGERKRIFGEIVSENFSNFLKNMNHVLKTPINQTQRYVHSCVLRKWYKSPKRESSKKQEKQLIQYKHNLSWKKKKKTKPWKQGDH